MEKRKKKKRPREPHGDEAWGCLLFNVCTICYKFYWTQYILPFFGENMVRRRCVICFIACKAIVWRNYLFKSTICTPICNLVWYKWDHPTQQYNTPPTTTTKKQMKMKMNENEQWQIYSNRSYALIYLHFFFFSVYPIFIARNKHHEMKKIINK